MCPIIPDLITEVREIVIVFTKCTFPLFWTGHYFQQIEEHLKNNDLLFKLS